MPHNHRCATSRHSQRHQTGARQRAWHRATQRRTSQQSTGTAAARSRPVNVYLDEFAHVQRDGQIYTATLPVISKGGRRRVGSSPMGARAGFWGEYSRQLRLILATTARHAVVEVSASAAILPKRANSRRRWTRQRNVGNVVRQRPHQGDFANMPLEDFQQEYECEFVDESHGMDHLGEIKRNQDAGLLRVSLPPGADNADRQCWQRLTTPPSFAVRTGFGAKVLSIGVDIGQSATRQRYSRLERRRRDHIRCA